MIINTGTRLARLAQEDITVDRGGAIALHARQAFSQVKTRPLVVQLARQAPQVKTLPLVVHLAQLGNTNQAEYVSFVKKEVTATMAAQQNAQRARRGTTEILESPVTPIKMTYCQTSAKHARKGCFNRNLAWTTNMHVEPVRKAFPAIRMQHQQSVHRALAVDSQATWVVKPVLLASTER